MAGELLGLLVIWTLIFALPVVVTWMVIRIAVTARSAIDKRRAVQHVPVSRDDTRDTTIPTSESDSDPDTLDSAPEDESVATRSGLRKYP